MVAEELARDCVSAFPGETTNWYAGMSCWRHAHRSRVYRVFFRAVQLRMIRAEIRVLKGRETAVYFPVAGKRAETYSKGTVETT
jgi:hypothetical protein